MAYGKQNSLSYPVTYPLLTHSYMLCNYVENDADVQESPYHDCLCFNLAGSARDLICTHFTDGMSELTIAYILLGMLKALEYIHHMGYVHR